MNAIGDYALIGDCHSAALVGRDGSIDWACFPRFDSPSVFCRILDEARGGSFSVAPDDVTTVRREYVVDTNVLTTTFDTPTGVVEVTDCMPVSAGAASLAHVVPTRSILRRVRCTSGTSDVAVAVAARFEYGAFVPRFRMLSETSGEIVGGADALFVRATRPLEAEPGALRGRWRLTDGDEVWIEAAWQPSYEPDPPPGDAASTAAALASELESTIDFWHGWMSRCTYDGDYADAVRRSALVLKALTYAPSGAVVAAPTTSLPEELGGERNWDYRYTWIRDSTLVLTSLFVLGFEAEAAAFKRWLERTGAGRPEDLQIMYGICGERLLPEVELDHLAGHRGSRPVRIGNGAVKQLQLDTYGQLFEAAYLYAKSGGELTAENWVFLAGVADVVCERWQLPDHGIWEIRDRPRHFIHSKLNCWLALERAVAIAGRLGEVDSVDRWSTTRDEIRAFLIAQAERGWFPQAPEYEVCDAATLLVPALGFLPSDHPAVLRTIEATRRSLERGGLVSRYLAPDGLPGGEGAFLLCSFWLLDALTHSGQLGEAEALLQRLLELRNDVGLYAEEVDVDTGEAGGNFPQAFSHMALVLSAAHLSAAKRGQLPVGAYAYAEVALDRLMTQGISH